MLVIKPVVLIEIRKLIEAHPQAAGFADALSPAAAKAYRDLAPASRLSVDIDGEIVAAAASFLHPRIPADQALPQLGRLVADSLFGKLFKSSLFGSTLTLFFRQVFHHAQAADEDQTFSSLPFEFLRGRLPEMWRNFYDRGEASISRLKPGSGEFMVQGLPEMHPAVRRYFCGFMQRILELAGASGVEVEMDESDPQAWRWSLRWTL